VAFEVARAQLPCVPAGHGVHAVSPSNSAYVPTAHTVHPSADAPPGRARAVPGAQRFSHTVEPLRAVHVPAAHRRHSEKDEATAYEPGAHGSRVELPGQEEPAGQGAQAVAAASVPSVNEPGGHARHGADELLPTAVDAEPAGHTSHWAAAERFSAADHAPAGHGKGAGAPAGQKLPAGQAAAAATVEPAAHVAPAAHGPLQAGDESPAAPPKRPAGQSSGSAWPPTQKEPAGHGVSASELFCGQKAPGRALHGVGEKDAAGQKNCAGQGVPPKEPLAQKVPAAHATFAAVMRTPQGGGPKGAV